MDEMPREDFVSVEPAPDGVRLLSEQPDGRTAIVVIPRDQAVEVTRRILHLARGRGDLRGVWGSSSPATRVRLVALLVVMVLLLMVGAHLAGEALPVGN